jgi:flavorubredoxin
MDVKLVEPGITVRYVPTTEDLKNCTEMGKRIADKMNAV